MKKSILIVLLVIFASTLWTVVAFGKASKTEKPIQKQKTEQNVELQFPAKVLPPPVESDQPVRGTVEDFQKAVTAKTGKTPAEIQQMQAQARARAGGKCHRGSHAGLLHSRESGSSHLLYLSACRELLPVMLGRCQVCDLSGHRQ